MQEWCALSSHQRGDDMHNQKIATLNLRHEVFWSQQRKIALQRMQMPDVRDMAEADIHASAVRGEAVYTRKSLERALADAATAQMLFSVQRARNAGSANKSNSFHALILEAALKQPKITAIELLARLNRLGGPGQSVNVVGDTIEIITPGRKVKYLDVSGLKDQLYRVKKQLKKQ
jgi:hypothetical protein